MKSDVKKMDEFAVGGKLKLYRITCLPENVESCKGRIREVLCNFRDPDCIQFFDYTEMTPPTLEFFINREELSMLLAAKMQIWTQQNAEEDHWVELEGG